MELSSIEHSFVFQVLASLLSTDTNHAATMYKVVQVDSSKKGRFYDLSGDTRFLNTSVTNAGAAIVNQSIMIGIECFKVSETELMLEFYTYGGELWPERVDHFDYSPPI